MIPTYNEIDNVAHIAREIIDLNLPCDILFIDDNSPDGTGEKLNNIKGMQGNINSIHIIHVIHRPGKQGVGSAHKCGIHYAYANGYKQLITMDCDGTHDPKMIPAFIECASDKNSCDIVIGSRHIDGGGLKDWSAWRKFVTYMGHILTQVLLDIPYDATGAFRLYRLDKIQEWMFFKVRSTGYSFFFESLTILNASGFKIVETPIVLSERSAGHSKLRFKDLISSLIDMLKLRYRLWFELYRLR